MKLMLLLIRQTALNPFKEIEDYLASNQRVAEEIQRQELAVAGQLVAALGGA